MELLDGQAFPVVGAGAMVWNGNVWTPASSSNPLHTRDAALASLIGALNAAKETNPDAASASMLALLRGMLATFGKETTLAAVKAAAESLAQEDFATEATLAALLSAVGNLATEATLSGVKSAVDTLAGTVADGAQKVQLQGSLPPSMMELAVNDWSELPDPTETPKGATAQLIGTFDVRQNTGTEWVEVVV